MKVEFTDSAEYSYEEEIIFILKKWNQKEVNNFAFLVDDFIISIAQSPYIGRQSNFKGYLQFTLSSQTTVYYQVNEKEQIIYIVYFWNNKQNPKTLKKYFSK